MIGKKYENRWVRDCLTNRDIVQFIIADGQLISGVPKSEFEKRKQELMDGCAK